MRVLKPIDYAIMKRHFRKNFFAVLAAKDLIHIIDILQAFFLHRTSRPSNLKQYYQLSTFAIRKPIPCKLVQ